MILILTASYSDRHTAFIKIVNPKFIILLYTIII